MIVWLPRSLVTVVDTSYVVSPRFHGSELTKPTIGFEMPLPMLIAVMPLVYVVEVGAGDADFGGRVQAGRRR